MVRVGTHGLRPSKSTLWGRLSQHKGSPGGSMPGGGNHRGSVFRLHVGAALLNAGSWPEEIRGTWSVGSAASKGVRAAEYPLERAVSEQIGAMSLLWVGVDDDPGPASDRGVIERGSIGLLSNLDRLTIDSASPHWLGRSAGRHQIRGSGLWNVNHVDDQPDCEWLGTLRAYLDRSHSP